MRAGLHSGYDRLVIQFTGIAVPRYEILPNPGSPAGGTTFLEDPKGDAVRVAGAYGVRIQIFATDWTHDRFASGTDLQPGYPTLKEARVVGDFEAITTIAVGLGGNVCPTVALLTSPPRLVIDFPAG